LGAVSSVVPQRLALRRWEDRVSVLRDYQSEIIDDFDRRVAGGVQSVPVTAPTGAGKTVIAAAIVTSAFAGGQHILVLAHCREIIDQTVSKPRNNRQGENPRFRVRQRPPALFVLKNEITEGDLSASLWEKAEACG
jgi:superfamily II DNA or RNA helicase